jgi:hypothetical protein
MAMKIENKRCSTLLRVREDMATGCGTGPVLRISFGACELNRSGDGIVKGWPERTERDRKARQKHYDEALSIFRKRMAGKESTPYDNMPRPPKGPTLG